MNRGIHSLPNRGLSNDWLSPPTITRALGRFDLDPCAHPDQDSFNRTASHMIHPPADGLAFDWYGRVWLNPPYGGELKAWIKRLAEHGRGTALVPARTEVESWFWPFVWEAADAILFIRGRLYFHRPDGSTAGNAGHGSVLAAYGGRDVDKIRKAVDGGKIAGRLVGLAHRCPACNGTGWPGIDSFDRPCSKCDGSGKVRE